MREATGAADKLGDVSRVRLKARRALMEASEVAIGFMLFLESKIEVTVISVNANGNHKGEWL